jgi:hypothetical protein
MSGAGAAPAAAQTSTFARLWPGNFVEVLDLQRNSWRRVYQSPAWSTNGLSVGPGGDRIAMLAWKEGTVKGHDYAEAPASTLVVIDTTGRVVAPGVPQVQRYAWCGARCIVYLTGIYEETDAGFRPNGVGRLDLATGKTRPLPSPPTPIGITWASFDSAAYVKNNPDVGESYIYRLDLARDSLAPTKLEDHLFSPTGRYYLVDAFDTDTLVLYDTRTNTPVDIEGFRRGAIVLGWVSAGEDLLLAVKRPPPRRRALGLTDARPRLRVKDPNKVDPYVRYMVYDLVARRVRSAVLGHLQDWSGSGNQRLVEREGKYYMLGAGTP